MKKLFVLFATVALVAAFTLPAAAADDDVWGFYGSARISTWYEGTSDKIGDIDTDNFNLNLQGNSRIGANVKHGAVSGRFEYGTGVNVRILWGEWDFGGGSFGVGQHYTPIDTFYSNQVWGSDEGLLSTGGMYTGRQPMLQLKMAGFKVALLQNAGTDLGTGSEEHPLPKVELSYGFTAGPAAMKFVGAAQTYTIDIVPNGIDESVTSWYTGLGAKFDIGAVALAGDIFYGQNIGQLGLYHSTMDDAVVVDRNLQDTDSVGGLLVAIFKATDMLAFELGVGYTESDNDSFLGKDDEIAYYGNVNITMAPGVYIIPEIGYYDYGDNSLGLDEGDMVYAGAKFQINF